MKLIRIPIKKCTFKLRESSRGLTIVNWFILVLRLLNPGALTRLKVHFLVGIRIRACLFLLIVCWMAQADCLIHEGCITTEPKCIQTQEPIQCFHNVGGVQIFLHNFGVLLEGGQSYTIPNQNTYQLTIQCLNGIGPYAYTTKEERPCTQCAFKKPAGVSDEVWAEVVPYLLPENHPVRAQLDALFSQGHLLTSLKTIQDAGFSKTPEQGLHVIAAVHPLLKGYVVKMYTENNPEHEWFPWVKRCQGAKLIRQSIATHRLQKKFKTPRKWIYVLPDNCVNEFSPGPKHFILIAEDMGIVSPSENRAYYRGKNFTKRTLRKIVMFCEELGLSDAVRCANLPLCKDGRLAFLDTESWHRWPIVYHKMKEWICSSMREYLTDITAKQRKK